jgi:hypothetical protein
MAAYVALTHYWEPNVWIIHPSQPGPSRPG